MCFDGFKFGSIQIDGSTYEHDVVIDRGVAHAWENNGSELAVWLAVVIDAYPIPSAVSAGQSAK